MQAFERFREHFGKTPPLGWCLRTDHAERWLRIHSLPGAKRYATNDDERAEIRDRARAAASEVLPTGGSILLISCVFDDGFGPLRLSRAPTLTFDEVGRYEHAQLETPCVAHATQAAWPHPDFDALVDAIANDMMEAVWFSVSSGEVFAPYDGGVDLVLESPARARALRHVFPADWFSERPDGL